MSTSKPGDPKGISKESYDLAVAIMKSLEDGAFPIDSVETPTRKEGGANRAPKKVLTGPRGGRYYMRKGQKVYL